MLPFHPNDTVRIAIVVIAVLLLVLRNVSRIRRWRSSARAKDRFRTDRRLI